MYKINFNNPCHVHFIDKRRIEPVQPPMAPPALSHFSYIFYSFVAYPAHSIPRRSFSTAFFSILDTYSPVKLGVKNFSYFPTALYFTFKRRVLKK